MNSAVPVFAVICFFLTFALGAHSNSTVHIRECFQPVRMQSSDNCIQPNVPLTIPLKKSCRHELGSDSCTVVTYALLAHYKIFDVVLVNAGLCRSDIQAGSFGEEDARRLLPQNEELVAMRLNGSDLIAAVEHGLDQYHVHGNDEAYPRVAGMRFLVRVDNAYGQRVKLAEVMMPNCRWKWLELDKEYTVLTSRNLALGAHSYSTMTRPLSSEGMGIGIADAFWQYCLRVCSVQDPFGKLMPDKIIPAPSVSITNQTKNTITI